MAEEAPVFRPQLPEADQRPIDPDFPMPPEEPGAQVDPDFPGQEKPLAKITTDQPLPPVANQEQTQAYIEEYIGKNNSRPRPVIRVDDAHSQAIAGNDAEMGVVEAKKMMKEISGTLVSEAATLTNQEVANLRQKAEEAYDAGVQARKDANDAEEAAQRTIDNGRGIAEKSEDLR